MQLRLSHHSWLSSRVIRLDLWTPTVCQNVDVFPVFSTTYQCNVCALSIFFPLKHITLDFFSTEVLPQLQCFVTVIKCPVKSNSREHRLIMSYSSRGLGCVMAENTWLHKGNVCSWGKKLIDSIAVRRKRMNRKWGWETKHHGLPRVTHFFQWGSTSYRFQSSQTVPPAQNQVWKHRTLWRTSRVQTSASRIWLSQVLDPKLFMQNSLKCN